ncbi:hypothetical protein B566_EDAN012997 [Ephemera danica]|nr:hypothetical protein B566_EDAN012997 [Ephemera danica]
MYGEQLVIFQYFPHISELIALCKRKLTINLEGGLIGCLVLLRHIVPYLSDASLMDHISDILKSILHPAVRLVATTRAPFPSGVVARTALAYKLLEALYVIGLRIGTDMTQLHLAPTLQRFFLAFDKAFGNTPAECGSMGKSYDENCYLDIKRDGTSMEWPIKGSPLQISHSRIKETDSADSFSPPVPLGNQDTSQEIRSKAMQELKMVFTEKLAHQAYLPFFRFIGENAFEQFLKNGPSIQKLCYDYEQQNPRLIQCQDQGHLLYLSDYLSPHEENERGTSGSFGSNVAVIGNRIELQRPDIPSIKPMCSPTCSSVTQEDVAALISKKMDNTSRHLHGNWLAYWEHEIGRAEKDMRFNFKQIKLQQFIGHTNSVRAIHALDNENSFMSGSRDKTVKLWSLRSQGDGRATTSCQWTYSNHRKSVLAIAFLESMRLVASCDSVVHLWDPFMGALVAQLDSSTSSRAVIPPVNVLRSMPAPSCCVLAATTDATLRVIDARTCSYVQELKVAPSTAGLIRCVAVGPSGNWVAVGQSSGHLSLLDIRTGMVLASWKGHEGEVLQLVTANESTMVSSSLDQSVGAWSTDLGNLKFHLKGPTEPVHCLSSYGSELISGTTANRIGVHTCVGDQACFSSTRLRSDTFRGVLTAMAVLPLNRLLLLGSDAGHISLLC